MKTATWESSGKNLSLLTTLILLGMLLAAAVRTPVGWAQPPAPVAAVDDSGNIYVVDGSGGTFSNYRLLWNSAYYARAIVTGDFNNEATWRKWREVDLLVIDESGVKAAEAKDWALERLTSLWRRRYDSCKRTIVLTNVQVQDWIAIFGNADGGRLLDRLREIEVKTGGSAFVSISEKSMRTSPAGGSPRATGSSAGSR